MSLVVSSEDRKSSLLTVCNPVQIRFDALGWRGSSATPQVRLESTGIRTQVVALVTAALDPTLFSEIVVHEGMRSLGYLLDVPVTFDQAPDLFCLDLYKEFDLDRIAALAAPTRLVQEKYLEPGAK